MRKNNLALLFFLLGAFSFLLTFNMTGNVIGFSVSDFNFIGLILIFISILFFVSRQGLDVIMIPTGVGYANKKRAERAIKEYTEHGGKYFLISGGIEREQNGKIVKDAAPYEIYNYLREHGIKPSQMIIEGTSRDTLENVLNSLEKLKGKGVHDVGVATGKTHNWRFRDLFDKAKKEGLIDKNFQVYPLETEETPKEFTYGVLAYVKDFLRTRRYSLREAKEHRSQGLSNKLKKSLE